MHAESVATVVANNSRGHNDKRSQGVSCRRYRAASPCSEYLRATSTAVMQACSGKLSGAHALQRIEDVPSEGAPSDERIHLRADTKGRLVVWRSPIGCTTGSSAQHGRSAMAEGTLQRTHHTSCVFAISANSMTSCAAMLQRDADSRHARQRREQHHRTR